jgi:hypothetical protein
MWALDSSGPRPAGLEYVAFPPPGYCPAPYFGPRYAFSVWIPRLAGRRLQDVRVEIHRLDEMLVPEPEPLALDHCGVSPGEYGPGPAVVFRPARIDLSPGIRYGVTIDGLPGRPSRLFYVVEFFRP